LTAGEGENLYPLGFMGEDLIYGVARQEDVSRNAVGSDRIYMYKVCICNTDGNILKEYAQENVYIVSCAKVSFFSIPRKFKTANSPISRKFKTANSPISRKFARGNGEREKGKGERLEVRG
jgi:hypothetical protein